MPSVLQLQAFGVWVLFAIGSDLPLILIERPVVNIFQYKVEHQAL